MTTDARPAGHDTPIAFTDAARDRVRQFIAGQDKPGLALRVSIQGRSSAGFRYAMAIVEEAEDGAEHDMSFDGGGFPVLVERRFVDDLIGATVDFVETPQGSGLQVNNPNPVWRDPLALKVASIIEDRINPGVAGHGGWVELLDVRGDVAYVRLGGGCQGCGLANVTLKQGIEAIIIEQAPEISRVVDDTDHASGENPYFQPAKS